MVKKVFSEVLGKYIEIPDEPRIVSLAPSITDTLYQLNLWDYIVGISIYCKVPKDVNEKPRVGSYLKVMYNRLDKLNPNIILVTTGIQRRIVNDLLSKGYTVYPIPLPISIYGILENIYIVGNLFDRVEEALDKIRHYNRILGEIGRGHYITVYYEVDLGEPTTVGGPSYITTSLSHIGLKNIFLDDVRAYFKPDFNEVRERDPHIIIYEEREGRRYTVDDLIKIFINRGLDDVNAIKNRSIIILPQDSLAHYGPSHIETLIKLKKILDRMM